MKNVSKFLSKEREKQGISLSDISKTTKISLSTLRAIEAGDRSSLPAEVYLKGFIFSYAKCLNLDINRVLELFNKDLEEKESEDSVSGVKQSDKKNKSEEVTFKDISSNILKYKLDSPIVKTFIVISTVVLIVAFFFVNQMIDKYTKEANVDNSIIATENFEEETSTTTITTTTTTNVVEATIGKVIEVSALAEINVTYIVDEEEEVHISLSSGEQVSITGNNIEIYADKGNSASLVVDGEEVGLMGDSDELAVYRSD